MDRMTQSHQTGVTATPKGSIGSRTVNLGRGLVVPYPEPANEAATKFGKANRRTDTKPEVLIRSALHRRGLRFRKDHPAEVGDLRVRVDIAFPRSKIAVLVDGCFWHRCPDHSRTPTRNLEYWLPKLQGNVDRDHRVNTALSSAGWTVLRVWEHEDVDAVADRIAAIVEARRGVR
jgi:DNA mismatch endonuclease (patch repair protein)